MTGTVAELNGGKDGHQSSDAEDAQVLREQVHALRLRIEELERQTHPQIPRPPIKTKHNRFAIPFLIGASSAMIWIMHNGFIPGYNSFVSQLFAIFYAPLLIGYVVYKLLSEVVRKQHHIKHPEGLTPKQMEALDTQCFWIGCVMGLSMTVSQIMSKLVYMDGLYQHIERSMGGWDGLMINDLPLEFHVGMMIATAVGFAFCFAAMVHSKKENPTLKDLLISVAVGLIVGAGLYVSFLIPGLNEVLHWGIPHGLSILTGAMANATVLTVALAAEPAMNEVNCDTPTTHTVLLSRTSVGADSAGTPAIRPAVPQALPASAQPQQLFYSGL